MFVAYSLPNSLSNAPFAASDSFCRCSIASTTVRSAIPITRFEIRPCLRISLQGFSTRSVIRRPTTDPARVQGILIALGTFQVLGSRLKPGSAEDSIVNAALALLAEATR